jgi:hypothetical protein
MVAQTQKTLIMATINSSNYRLIKFSTKNHLELHRNEKPNIFGRYTYLITDRKHHHGDRIVISVGLGRVKMFNLFDKLN